MRCCECCAGSPTCSDAKTRAEPNNRTMIALTVEGVNGRIESGASSSAPIGKGSFEITHCMGVRPEDRNRST